MTDILTWPATPSHSMKYKINGTTMWSEKLVQTDYKYYKVSEINSVVELLKETVAYASVFCC